MTSKKQAPREWTLSSYNYYSESISTTLTAYSENELWKLEGVMDTVRLKVVEMSALTEAQAEAAKYKQLAKDLAGILRFTRKLLDGVAHEVVTDAIAAYDAATKEEK